MAAAEMVGRLLERYALSMEEIDLREERCVQVKYRLVASSDGRSMAASPRLPGSVTARFGSHGTI